MKLKIGKLNYAVTRSRVLAAITGLVGIAASVNAWITDHPDLHVPQKYTFILVLIPIICDNLLPKPDHHPKDSIDPPPGTGVAQDAVSTLTPKGM